VYNFKEEMMRVPEKTELMINILVPSLGIDEKYIDNYIQNILLMIMKHNEEQEQMAVRY
jgi:hypothetical protein